MHTGMSTSIIITQVLLSNIGLQFKRRILKSKQFLEQHKAKDKQGKEWGFAATTKMRQSVYGGPSTNPEAG